MSRKAQNALLTLSALAMATGADMSMFGNAIKKVRQPDILFTDEELEHLDTFEDTREGRKAKKKYVKEVQARHRGQSSNA